MPTQYLTNIQVSEDLVVEAWTSEAYSGALLCRQGGGIVGIYPQEIKPLIEALSKAAKALVEAMPEALSKAAEALVEAMPEEKEPIG